MLAATFDLVLVLAAVSVVAALWFQRKVLKPQSVWEKLMVGSTMIAFALTVRLADTALGEMPWPILADPRVQAIVVAIALLGGALAVAAGLADWIPALVREGVAGRWRERWAQAHRDLGIRVEGAEEAGQIIAALTGHFRMLCETQRVAYCAYQQRTRTFTNRNAAERNIPRRWQPILTSLESSRYPESLPTTDGALVAIPVAVDSRLYGAIIIDYRGDHPSRHDMSLLGQTAQQAALALHGVVRRSLQAHQVKLAATVEELEATIGAGEDPVDDLMEMLELAHRELNIDYAAVLQYEAGGAYAQRYSHYWSAQRLTERGLQVPLSDAATAETHEETRAYVSDRGAKVISAAAVPHRGLQYRLAVPLRRGRNTIGLLVVASHTHALNIQAIDTLNRWAASFAAAVERVAFTQLTRKASRRLTSLGNAAPMTRVSDGTMDQLTTDILDEIPGTFCQYMKVVPERNALVVEYRRARREGWGHNTQGMLFTLEGLPNCRMVIDNGKSVLFRQDDPERMFDPQEAENVFGAIPNSLLMIPVTQDGDCKALLAVGEMREPQRHTYTSEDRNFADSYIRLLTPDRTPRSSRLQLDTYQDVNFTFAGPLTGIIGSVEILRQQLKDNGAAEKYLNVIERNADRIRGAVGELVDVQQGQLPGILKRQREIPSTAPMIPQS